MIFFIRAVQAELKPSFGETDQWSTSQVSENVFMTSASLEVGLIKIFSFCLKPGGELLINFSAIASFS